MPTNINGYRLYELRNEMGYSQEDLAELLGITRQAVQKWENGKSKPSSKKLKKLSKIFGVSIDYLLDNASDNNDKQDKHITERQANALVSERHISERQIVTTEKEIEIAATEQKEKANKPKRKIPKAGVICLIVITAALVIFCAVIGFIVLTPNKGLETEHTFDILNPLSLIFMGLIFVIVILVIITICVALKRRNK